jgi:ubiquinone/menaquinone biosynthesis C-methylase UbiE
LDYPGLECQPDRGASQGHVLRSVKRFLRTQFGQPAGLCGDIVGRIMAHTKSNSERIDWTLSLLKIGPKDRVLEIGFGPGIAIERVSRIAGEGFTAGVDHSEVMVKQASRRNVEQIKRGKVTLALGSPLELPAFGEPFDKIFTINSIHFWNRPVDCLAELRKLLRPGGLIAVTIQPRTRGASMETTRILGAEIAANLERAGFVNLQSEVMMGKDAPAICVRGRN